MPLYEYRCDSCSGRFEVLASFAERERQACPNCDSQQTRVLVSSFGLVAVGDGFAAESGDGGCCGGGCGSCGCSAN